jgi:hypothetical protein
MRTAICKRTTICFAQVRAGDAIATDGTARDDINA